MKIQTYNAGLIEKAILTFSILVLSLAILEIDISQAFVGNEDRERSQEAKSQQTEKPGEARPQKAKVYKYAPARLIVKLKEGKKLDDIKELNDKYRIITRKRVFKERVTPKIRTKVQQKLNARLEKRKKRAPMGAKVPDLDRTYLLKADDAKIHVPSMVREYAAHPSVEYAEPDYVVETFMVPNDPSYSQQWAHQNMQSESAWDISTGSSNVIIAIVDTGIDYNHEDLSANIWYNAGETPGNGLDDDGNGYADDYYGYDFYNNDGDPKDDHGHGTHTAGIAAAVANNSRGVAGLSASAKIMGVKFLSASGSGYLSGGADSIRYAADSGADVISNSWGGGGYSVTLNDAINYAYSQGCFLVAAAGNSNSSEIMYPAGYANMLAVAATDSSDVRAYFSNYGSWVDVSAPGVAILSTLPQYAVTLNNYGYSQNYDELSGTSMACPYVAGLASLVVSENPTWTNDQVTVQVKYATDNIDAQNPNYVGLLGQGRINAYLGINGQPRIITSSPLPIAYASQSYSTTLQVSGGTSPYAWTLTVGSLPGGLSLNSTTGGISGTPTTPGSFSFTIKVTDSASRTATGDFELTVVNELVISTSSPLPQATEGAGYSTTLEATGGTSPYSWSSADSGTYTESDPGTGWIGGGTARGWRADDASYSLTLPFGFPYYGTEYSSVYVCTNGFLDFSSSYADYSNSQSELLSNVRIAPLWDDIRTDGTDEDIYVTETSEYVVIRWAGELYYYGNPVNFEVVLYSNGNIKFNYGAGHTGLTPTIGVSSGDSTDYTLSSHNNATTISANVSSLLTYVGTLPAGLSLESSSGIISGTPTQGGTYQFTIEVVDSTSQQQSATKEFTLVVMPKFVTDTDTVTVTEGSTATFQVKLSAQPSSSITASVAHVSGDSDISVQSGSSLTFTTSNWGTYQTVTLTAAEDTDALNGSATIRVSATGIANKDITATEDDNDVPIIMVTPSETVDFGTVVLGSSKELDAFTVKNIGGGTLTGVASVSTPFSVVSGGSYSLSAGQSQVVRIKFAPGSSGSVNETVTFTGGGGATRTVTGTGNAPPSLTSGGVSPSSGETTDSFAYSVTYTDTDNDAPTTKYVYIDSTAYTMSSSDSSYSDGSVFSYSTTLSSSSHNYYFEFSNSYGTVRLPTSGTYSGPTVNEHVYSSPQNLSFETDGNSDGIPDNWNREYGTGSSSSWGISSGEYYSGTKSAYVTYRSDGSDDSASFKSTPVSAIPGQPYEFSIYLKGNSALKSRLFVVDHSTYGTGNASWGELAISNTETGWTQYRLRYIPKTESVFMRIDNLTDGATLYIDSASLSEVSNVSNHSFENVSGTLPTSWSTYDETEGVAQFGVTASDYKSGSTSATINVPGTTPAGKSAGYVSGLMSVLSGMKYTFTVYLKNSSSGNMSRIFLVDEGGATFYGYVINDTLTGWTQYQVEYTPTQSNVYVRVDNFGGTLYMDSANLEPAALCQNSSFEAGATPDGAPLDWTTKIWPSGSLSSSIWLANSSRSRDFSNSASIYFDNSGGANAASLVSKEIELARNDTYNLSVYLRSDTANARAAVYIIDYGSGNTSYGEIQCNGGSSSTARGHEDSYPPVNGWQNYTLSYTPSYDTGSIMRATIRIDNLSPGSTLYIDSISLEEHSNISNHSFEVDKNSDGIADNWNKYRGSGDTVWEITESEYYHGEKAGYMSIPDGALSTYRSGEISVVSGTSYACSIWVKGSASGESFGLYVIDVGGEGSGDWSGGAYTTNTTWTKYTVTHTPSTLYTEPVAPGGDTRVWVRIDNSGSSGTILYFDEAHLE